MIAFGTYHPLYALSVILRCLICLGEKRREIRQQPLGVSGGGDNPFKRSPPIFHFYCLDAFPAKDFKYIQMIS